MTKIYHFEPWISVGLSSELSSALCTRAKLPTGTLIWKLNQRPWSRAQINFSILLPRMPPCSLSAWMIRSLSSLLVGHRMSSRYAHPFHSSFYSWSFALPTKRLWYNRRTSRMGAQFPSGSAWTRNMTTFSIFAFCLCKRNQYAKCEVLSKDACRLVLHPW